MVIDHHQLNVFGLIFYTVIYMWSLKVIIIETDRHLDQHQDEFENSTHSKHKYQLMLSVSS